MARNGCEIVFRVVEWRDIDAFGANFEEGLRICATQQ
jgi:hypothetical protein